MKIFFSSPGRRVELIKLFKKEVKDLYAVGGDYSSTSPALFFCDKIYKLHYEIDGNYAKKVLEICKKEKIDLVVPLIDYELELYSKYYQEFKSHGIEIMICNENTIEICIDKLKTFEKFEKFDFIKTPYTSLVKDYLESQFKTQYVILKPKNGSSGIGIYKIKKQKVKDFVRIMELNEEKYIVQEYIDFEFEVTVDVFIDKFGEIIEFCQRKRIKTRGGEVERAITIKDENIKTILENIAKEIKFYGVVNIQIMKEGNSYFIGEINPRFGGGFPLSYYSGANMVEHLVKILKNEDIIKYSDNRYKNNFYMLRYDDAVFTDELLND